MKIVLISLYYLTSFSSFADYSIDVNVYSTGNLYDSSNKVEKGLNLLKASLSKSCQIDLTFQLNIFKNTSDENINFKSTSRYEAVSTHYGKEEMIFFQKPLYNYLLKNELLKEKNAISIHYVNDVHGHCGFAFPKVQLSKIKSKSLINYLSNNILISTSAKGCGSDARLLTHEISHLLIQDNPAHMCGNRKCDERNILSVFRRVNSSRHMDRNGQLDGQFPRPIRDDMHTQLLPSTGLAFDNQQCTSVIENLKKFL